MRCDIFCKVIDNYGDVGVCWRLARQLANEYGLTVCLWVDNLHSLSKLCPEVDPDLLSQCRRGVRVRHWDSCEGVVADWVIGTFDCKLPQNYLLAMAALAQAPVWVNLDYLSAEDWVHGCHGLPSPHPSLPLTRYFFFPGFTSQTGGLIVEHDYFERRAAFMEEVALQQAFWHSIGMVMPAQNVLKISLFSYQNTALEGLLEVWASSSEPVLCLVSEGPILVQLAKYFKLDALNAGQTYVDARLTVRILPFVEQERYDEILWACDVNFVRGEDSLVRAQFAAKPFIWQIYPQQDAVHLTKLAAFLDRYTARLGVEASQALRGLWCAWNRGGAAGQAWPAFALARVNLQQYAWNWAQEKAVNRLGLNLLEFCEKIGRMHAFKNEG